MARLSDLIESFIKQMLETSEQSVLEIQRNELANVFNCAPSQINYVLTTRFTLNRGYHIESKRGGGGCIKITRIETNRNDYIRSVIWNNIGSEISQQEGEEYIDIFKSRGIVTEREAILMKCGISDKVLLLPDDIRKSIRAKILKTMLINIVD
jgi:transcriptional regulator of stress and heat shock response